MPDTSTTKIHIIYIKVLNSTHKITLIFISPTVNADCQQKPKIGSKSVLREVLM